MCVCVCTTFEGTAPESIGSLHSRLCSNSERLMPRELIPQLRNNTQVKRGTAFQLCYRHMLSLLIVNKRRARILELLPTASYGLRSLF
jgi:hypothetical protein